MASTRPARPNGGADDSEDDGGDSSGGAHAHAHAKRQRVSRACETCRNRKTRCEGTLPACDTCVRLGTVCRYLPQRKRGPQKGSQTAASTRLKELESLLMAVIRQRNDVAPPQQQQHTHTHTYTHAHGQHAPRHRSGSPRVSAVATPDGDSGRAGQADTPAFEDQAMADPLDPTTPPPAPVDDGSQIVRPAVLTRKIDGTSRFFGPTSGSYVLIFSSWNAVTRMIQQGQWPPPPELTPPRGWFGSPVGPPIEPLNAPSVSVELALDLARVYRQHWHGLLPILLDADDFIASLSAPGPGTARPPDFLVDSLAAFAATLDPQLGLALAAHIGKNDVTAAVDSLVGRASTSLVYVADQPQLACIQAHAMLALATINAGRAQRAWLHASQAVRLAQELGLHPNNAPLAALPPSVRLMRARIWWICVILDVHVSIGFGRPSNIDQQDAEATLETILILQKRLRSHQSREAEAAQEDSRHVPSAHSPVVHHLMTDNDHYLVALVALSVLHGRIMRLLNSQIQPTTPIELLSAVHSKEESLNAWHASLPEAFQDARASPAATHLHASYHSARIVLLRACIPLVRPSVGANRDDPTVQLIVDAGQKALSKCIESAAEICHLTKLWSTDNPAQHFPFYLHYVMQACTVHMIRIFWDLEGTEKQFARKDIAQCLTALLNLSKFCPSALRRMGWFLGNLRLLGLGLPDHEQQWTRTMTSLGIATSPAAGRGGGSGQPSPSPSSETQPLHSSRSAGAQGEVAGGSKSLRAQAANGLVSMSRLATVPPPPRASGSARRPAPTTARPGRAYDDDANGTTTDSAAARHVTAIERLSVLGASPGLTDQMYKDKSAAAAAAGAEMHARSRKRARVASNGAAGEGLIGVQGGNDVTHGGAAPLGISVEAAHQLFVLLQARPPEEGSWTYPSELFGSGDSWDMWSSLGGFMGGGDTAGILPVYTLDGAVEAPVSPNSWPSLSGPGM